MKAIVILLMFIGLLSAQDFQLSAKKWQLLGTSQDVNISALNLKDEDTLWQFNDNNWQYYKKNVNNISLTKITQLAGGSGFWIRSLNDYTLHIPDSTKKERLAKSGWNLLTPSFSDINLTKDTTHYKDVSIFWTYKNGIWRYYKKNGIHQFDTLKVGNGFWAYVTPTMLGVGETQTPIINGKFQKVYKNRSDNVNDIWNISLKIDVQNTSNFNIGVKFLKKSSGAIGEIVFLGLNIVNQKISSPEYIYIKGTKSNGDSGSTSFDSTYDPDNLRTKSITLNGDILTIKLGTIMQYQKLTDVATFKGVSNYNIVIVPEKIKVFGGKEQSLSNLVDLVHIYNGLGVSGDIEIR